MGYASEQHGRRVRVKKKSADLVWIVMETTKWSNECGELQLSPPNVFSKEDVCSVQGTIGIVSRAQRMARENVTGQAGRLSSNEAGHLHANLSVAPVLAVRGRSTTLRYRARRYAE